MQPRLAFDVAILGDGPAAAATAFPLAKAGARVALVSSTRKNTARTGHGECLPPAGNTWLRYFGVAERLRDQGALPIVAQRSCWGSIEIDSSELIRGPYGGGWIVDRAQLDEWLRQAAIAAGAVSLRKRPGPVSRTRGSWDLATAEGTASARYLVDATGRAASAAHKLGARTLCPDRLVAIALRARTQRSSDQDRSTYVESAPTGWWYSCRTGPQERIVTWFTDADLLRKTAAGRLRDFHDRLNESVGLKDMLTTHAYDPGSRIEVAIARNSRLDRLHGDGWLAVGDAATAHDPLGGHGILSAMDAGRWAARALVETAKGDTGAFRLYASFLDERHRAYQRHLARVYSAETRWAGRPFWKRRIVPPQARPVETEESTPFPPRGLLAHPID